MNNHVFVDTSALIAIGNKRDAFHAQAIGINDPFILFFDWLSNSKAINIS